MYKYLPTDRKKIYDSPHMEIFGLILHNTEELNERFLKLLVACAMEPKWAIFIRSNRSVSETIANDNFIDWVCSNS
jgi:hypothetical protein